MKLYMNRINGYALFMFFVGMFIYRQFEDQSLVVAIPILILWMTRNIEFSYEAEKKNQRKRRVNYD